MNIGARLGSQARMIWGGAGIGGTKFCAVQRYGMF